jgi:hypothetical protein
MKNKTVSAVQMMRDIRDELSKRYINNKEILIKDMDKIRKKHGMQTKKKTESS